MMRKSVYLIVVVLAVALTPTTWASAATPDGGVPTLAAALAVLPASADSSCGASHRDASALESPAEAIVQATITCSNFCTCTTLCSIGCRNDVTGLWTTCGKSGNACIGGPGC